MTGLSLFTGIGGMDLAFEAAGGNVTAMCERDDFCRSILRRYWPNVPIHEDVKTLRGEEIGAVDVIFGGFPCQGFSVAGLQKGKEDPRYLWPQFSRLVRELKPAWVVGENVPGIMRLAADDICADLEHQGYAVGILCYEAASVGALHRRSRIFFVAHAGRSLRKRGAISGTLCAEHEGWQAADFERSGSASFTEFSAPTGGKNENNAALGDAEGERCDNRSDGAAVGSAAGENNASCGAGAFISYSESGGWREGATDSNRSEEGGKTRTWDRPAAVRATLSDSDGSRRLQPTRQFQEFRKRACDICKTVPDSKRQRTGGVAKQSEEQHATVPEYGEWAALEPTEHYSGRKLEPCLGRMADGLPSWLDSDWWQNEPNIPRIAPRGVLNRVQRLKALGNAVVPAQIYPIFKAITEIHEAGDHECSC
jgi:site-specific DNA-cytosine methylase